MSVSVSSNAFFKLKMFPSCLQIFFRSDFLTHHITVLQAVVIFNKKFMIQTRLYIVSNCAHFYESLIFRKNISMIF